MRSNKIVVIFLFLAILGLTFNLSFVQAQSITQFGNLNYNESWNLQGKVIVASQFNLQQSLTVTWMSVLMQDNAPYSSIRLGIFTDRNNQPYMCLGSTTLFPAQINMGWYKLPLSTAVTLQPGTYWLAEIDSGACVIKYIDTPSSSHTVSTFINSDDPSVVFGPLNVGNVMPTQLNTVSGTLAIVASSGPPSIPNTQPPPDYAGGAQCWTSESSSNPYPAQTDFIAGTPVYIYWSPYTPSTGVVDICIYYPFGTAVGHAMFRSFIDLAPGDAPIQFVPTYGGTWVVTCNGYSTTIAVTNVEVSGNTFVVPEYPLGALSAIVACLAGLSLFMLRHNITKKKM